MKIFIIGTNIWKIIKPEGVEAHFVIGTNFWRILHTVPLHSKCTGLLTFENLFTNLYIYIYISVVNVLGRWRLRISLLYLMIAWCKNMVWARQLRPTDFTHLVFFTNLADTFIFYDSIVREHGVGRGLPPRWYPNRQQRQDYRGHLTYPFETKIVLY